MRQARMLLFSARLVSIFNLSNIERSYFILTRRSARYAHKMRERLRDGERETEREQRHDILSPPRALESIVTLAFVWLNYHSDRSADRPRTFDRTSSTIEFESSRGEARAFGWWEKERRERGEEGWQRGWGEERGERERAHETDFMSRLYQLYRYPMKLNRVKHPITEECIPIEYINKRIIFYHFLMSI